MVEKDPGTPDESALELPSFGLRRKKRKRGAAGAPSGEQETAIPAEVAEPELAESGVTEPELAESGVTEPEVTEPAVVETISVPEVAAELEVEDTRDDTPAVPDASADEPTVIIEKPARLAPAAASPVASSPVASSPVASSPAASSPAAASPAAGPSAAAEDHDTLVQKTSAVDEDAADEDAGYGHAGDEDADTDSRPSGFVLPALAPMTAAVLTGLVIGLALVGLTALSMRGCKAVNGTSSCGNPGLLLVLAILITLIFAGGALLRAFNVADPGSTSFLAVGVTTVIALVFLIDVLFAWWMVIVIPVVAMLSFALSHWVATNFAEPARD
ncbi:hypothetical protein [Nocardioides pacificus]